MKEKRITLLEQLEMGRALDIIIKTKSWRLLGCFWNTYWEFYIDNSNGDIVIKYK